MGAVSGRDSSRPAAGVVRVTMSLITFGWGSPAVSPRVPSSSDERSSGITWFQRWADHLRLCEKPQAANRHFFPNSAAGLPSIVFSPGNAFSASRA